MNISKASEGEIHNVILIEKGIKWAGNQWQKTHSTIQSTSRKNSRWYKHVHILIVDNDKDINTQNHAKQQAILIKIIFCLEKNIFYYRFNCFLCIPKIS